MRTLRMGMIGFGQVARAHHYGAYQALKGEGAPVELASVCDADPECLDLAGGLPGYTDWREMIERESLDAVDICLPTFLHEPVACACMEAGLHVLCEKPMALDAAECARMIACRDDTGRTLMIAHPLRFYAPYRLMADLIASDELGAPRTALFTRSMMAPRKSGPWMMRPERSGGVVLDVMVHDLDAMDMLFGAPNSASASVRDLPGARVPGSASARLQWDDGRYATLVANWLPCYNLHAQRTGRLDFERGYVYFDLNRGVLDVVRGEADVRSHADWIADPMYRNEIEYFANCALQREPPERCPPERSMAAVALCGLLCKD